MMTIITIIIMIIIIIIIPRDKYTYHAPYNQVKFYMILKSNK